jgi:ribosomal protein L7/L12
MLSQQVKDKIRDLLAQGKKIEAMKYLRDQYPISLPEANDLITTFSDNLKSGNEAIFEPKEQALTFLAKEKVKAMLQNGQKLKAISYLMKDFSIPLKEAKELVDSFGINTRGKTVSIFQGKSALFYIFACLGILFISIAAYIWWLDYSLTHHGTRVTGEVVELSYEYNNTENGAIPIISYQWESTLRTYQGNVYSNPPSYVVGEKVDLIISADNPNKVVLDSIVERFLLAIIFGFLGCVICLITYFGIK